MHFSELPLVKQNTMFEAGSEPVFHSPRLCASSPQPCRGVAVPVPGLAGEELISQPFQISFCRGVALPVSGLAGGERISQRFHISFPFSLVCEQQRVTGNGSGWGRPVRSARCEGRDAREGFVRQLLEPKGSTGAPGRATEQIPEGQHKQEEP